MGGEVCLWRRVVSCGKKSIKVRLFVSAAVRKGHTSRSVCIISRLHEWFLAKEVPVAYTGLDRENNREVDFSVLRGKSAREHLCRKTSALKK